MGLLLYYAKLDWVPGPGRLDFFYDGLVDPVTGVLLIDSALAREWDVFWNAASHIVLPAAILGYFSLAYISRMTRSFMLEQLSQEYITTARRSEEHTSELQSLMRISYAVFCLKKKKCK